MKALQIAGEGNLQVIEMEQPSTPKAGEVLLKVEYVFSPNNYILQHHILACGRKYEKVC